MTTLVTGGAGFLGSALVRRLLEDGHQVRVFLRAGTDRRNIDNLPVDHFVGDLRDRSSLDHALKGCDTLFHTAADYRLWTPRPGEMYDTNVGGTRNVMLASLSAGIGRVVHTSSVATIRPAPGLNIADETTPSALQDMVGHYKRSKFMAEEEVRRLTVEEGLPAVIVNPSTPVGPRDNRPTPTGRMILDAASGRMPAYVDTGLNLVHVDDVADGHLRACRKGIIGERYILGGENMTLKEILENLSTITGFPVPRIRLGPGLVLPLAYFSEAWARISKKKEPRITREGVRMSRHHMYFSSEKAITGLGYSPRPAIEALREAVDWYREHGFCPRGPAQGI
jgi:dihydroflavonol-4-reductase